MVFFAVAMMWAYPYSEYKKLEPETRTSIWRPLWDSINYCKLSSYQPLASTHTPDSPQSRFRLRNLDIFEVPHRFHPTQARDPRLNHCTLYPNTRWREDKL